MTHVSRFSAHHSTFNVSLQAMCLWRSEIALGDFENAGSFLYDSLSQWLSRMLQIILRSKWKLSRTTKRTCKSGHRGRTESGAAVRVALFLLPCIALALIVRIRPVVFADAPRQFHCSNHATNQNQWFKIYHALHQFRLDIAYFVALDTWMHLLTSMRFWNFI